MIQNVFKEAMTILSNNWLKIIGMVLLTYFIKLLLGTVPIQGSVSIRMDPLAVSSLDSIQSLLIGPLVNSILFFILLQYIILTKNTMRKRFLTAITYPFRNARLLYKGLIVLIISNFLLYLIGMLAIYTVIIFLAIIPVGLNLGTGSIIAGFIILYGILFWLYLGTSQALYLLHDDPKLGIFRSVKQSFSLMKGNRWSLFGLFLLTGLGFIIGILLLLVGAIFSIVVYEVARLAFYRELLRKKRKKEWQDKVQRVD
ncbi:DUF975 family protein [Paraliobacillus zengyii]|uniref:DUF975 family protein n=1 Tax=Paraliobacillus zengyii TaxID=2213194 RepID=UPI000DD497F6|nr:DUF975 family protein [Paraliobacillus zengyii]